MLFHVLNLKKGKKMNVIKFENKNKNDEKKVENINMKKEILRYHMKLEESTSYYFAVDVESEEDDKKNNTKAITMAWNVINNKLVDLDNIRIGGGFRQEILKKEKIDSEDKSK